MKHTILAAAIGLFALPCFAQGYANNSSPTIGLSYTSLKIKLDDLPNADWKTDAIGIQGSIPLTDNIWTEAKLLTGTNSNTSFGVRMDLDHYIGVNLLGRLPILTTGFSLYGSVGVGSTRLTASAPGFADESYSDSGLGYGFGLMYSTGPLDLRVGYESLYSDEGIEVDGMNLSGSYRF